MLNETILTLTIGKNGNIDPIGFLTNGTTIELVQEDKIRDLKENLVPPAGIEPALREELDFESNASTSSAREALRAMYYMDFRYAIGNR